MSQGYTNTDCISFVGEFGNKWMVFGNVMNSSVDYMTLKSCSIQWDGKWKVGCEGFFKGQTNFSWKDRFVSGTQPLMLERYFVEKQKIKVKFWIH